ncbi:ABC transporter substrate-binding protein [Petrotoga mexicana DSM 14811]|uniref:ABC transporter substrate-binding protein n=1 Tax=Petrotoga mexicana DSM 14811 TaxID=1122954 RepID=A0A2K1PC41_9BACT|nr:ABC transporter substrate-binding protein [Petrotoga mexicana]PNS00363.1 ABC transporter substrate-binding protein [Petrotoga mexicana DSM 14811]
MKKIFVVLSVLTLVIFGFSQQNGGVLQIGIETEPVGFDPNLVTAFASFRILENVYDGLLKYDENMNLVPNIAEKYEVPDPNTIIFTIRDNVYFHNGEKLTIEDVLYTFERIMDEEVGSPAAAYYSEVESIEVLDSKRIQFKLKVPMANTLLINFASTNSAIVSKEFVETGNNLQLKTNGTGPFFMSEYVPGDHITLEKNSNYFIPNQPYLDKIIFRIMPEEISRVTALRNGDVDLIEIKEPLSLRSLQSNNYKVYRQPALSYYLLGFNTTREPLNNPRVRSALSLAIDREEIINMVAFGEGTITGPINPTVQPWTITPENFEEYEYNPEKAKSILAEVGYPNGFEFNIMTASRYSFDKIAQVIQSQLSKIGVKVNIELVEWGIFLNRWGESDFDSFISLNSGSIDPDVQFYRTFHSNGSTNVFLYNNSIVDKLLEEGRKEPNVVERIKIYNQLQNILVKEAPILFLYSPNVLYASQSYVEGFKPLANESLIFLRETRIEE